MSRQWLILASGAIFLVLALSGFILLRVLEQNERLAARVKLSQGLASTDAAKRQITVKRVWERTVAFLGTMLLRTGLLSARTRADLETTLFSAGLRSGSGLEVFVGSKISLAVGLPALVTVFEHSVELPSMLAMILPFAAGAVGLLLPDVVVRHRHASYLKRVEAGLPDMLDLLVICSQSGLGLTAAIVRVADEMRQGAEDIGVEMALTANELHYMETRQALTNLGSRTNIRGLVRLGTTLVQSMQYGTPLTESMRVLSAEMRQEVLTRFEAKAARLGVLLTMPMIVFILPCVFLVVGGPAVVQAMHIGSQ